MGRERDGRATRRDGGLDARRVPRPILRARAAAGGVALLRTEGVAVRAQRGQMAGPQGPDTPEEEADGVTDRSAAESWRDVCRLLGLRGTLRTAKLLRVGQLSPVSFHRGLILFEVATELVL